MFLLIIINFVTFIMDQVKRIQNAIELRRPESVYNNLSVELNIDVENESNAMDTQSRRLVFVLSTVYTIFWLPFYSLRGHYELVGNQSFDLIFLQLFAYIFGYFNSCVTPFVILIAFPESRILLRKINEIEGIEKLKFWKRFYRQST